MNATRNAPALCIATLLLSACGSGGGVKIATPSAPLPTSPPPPPPAVKAIDEGMLHVSGTLDADVIIGPKGTLLLDGTIRGNVTNNGAGALVPYNDPVPAGLIYLDDGGMRMSGVVVGNVINNGPLQLDGNPHRIGRNPSNRIEGDFRQSATGMLGVPLPSGDGAVSHPLSITGHAQIEGGTLWLYRVCDCWDLPAEPLPTRPVGVHALHADGGVSGRFDGWISPALFIEGSVRYEANDVWFDLARASVATAMAAQSVGGLTLVSAGNIDAALARADLYVALPPAALGVAQRRFLASASSLLWMQDRAQAARALDSLAGHAHASMQAMLHDQVAAASARTDARLAALAYSTQPLAWSDTAMYSTGGQSFAGLEGGYAQWLSPRLLVGASLGDGQYSLQFDRLGGQGQGDAPAASLYAHYRGDGWHLTALAGAQHSTLQLQRPIELGTAGTHWAHSQRVLDQAFVHGEAGRDWALGGGMLTPFAAVDLTSLRSDRFVEHGTTGFELAGAAGRQAALSATLGARYTRTWNFAQPLRLELAADYQHGLADDGTPLRAAFGGVPDAWFELPRLDQDGFGELRLGLAGALDRHWDWSMDYARGFGGDLPDAAFRVGLQRGF